MRGHLVAHHSAKVTESTAAGAAPQRAGLVLAALILGAAVANLNLAVANVALPSIGEAFDSSQTSLNMVAVGYSLGLAASVLYLGAIGDRYGRKLLLVLGITLSIPACLLAAYAPNDTVLIIARIFGGVAAGMAYPTTLALIAALWSGPGRTKTIALWSALGGAISSLGPLMSGFLLEHFWWGSVFLVTLPLAVVALVMAVLFVPAHVNEGTEPVDNLGGVLSVVLVGALVVGINFAAVPGSKALLIGMGAIVLAAGGAFILRQRRARQPALRPRGGRAPDLLGRRTRRDHRVRLADGRDVHRPAVPPERARLLDPRGRDGDHPGRRDDGADRAPLREARRVARRPLHAAGRLLLRAPRFPHDAAALERGQRLLAVGLAYALVGAGVGFAGTRRRTRSPERCRCAGSAWRRAPPTCSETSAARSCSSIFGALLVGGLRVVVHLGDRRLAGREQDLGQHRGGAHQVVRQRRRGRPAEPEVRDPDHRRGEGVVPRRRPLGLPRRDRRGAARRRSWWPRCSRARSASRRCSRSTTRRTSPPRTSPVRN